MVPPVNFTIRCEYNGKGFDIRNFSAYVERTIAIPEGVESTAACEGLPDGYRHTGLQRFGTGPASAGETLSAPLFRKALSGEP